MKTAVTGIATNPKCAALVECLYRYYHRKVPTKEARTIPLSGKEAWRGSV